MGGSVHISLANAPHLVGLGVTICAVGGHAVRLVADEVLHPHSGRELGHCYDGDLAVSLTVPFFVLRKVF